jgi:hypothetical protein
MQLDNQWIMNCWSVSGATIDSHSTQTDTSQSLKKLYVVAFLLLKGPYLRYLSQLPPPKFPSDLLAYVDIHFRDQQKSTNSPVFSPRFFDSYLRLCIGMARLCHSDIVTRVHIQDAFDLLKSCSDSTDAFGGTFTDLRKGGQYNYNQIANTLLSVTQLSECGDHSYLYICRRPCGECE